MPYFSNLSNDRLNTCHADLQRLFRKVVERYDCTILEGFRNEEEQTAAFDRGNSKLKFPAGKHNRNPSWAVDCSPWPVIWNDRPRFYHFAGYVQAVADELGIVIRFGGDWDSDRNFTEENFKDLVHFELVR